MREVRTPRLRIVGPEKTAGGAGRRGPVGVPPGRESGARPRV